MGYKRTQIVVKTDTFTIAVIGVESAVKYSFVYEGIQTRRKGQYKADLTLSPRLHVKPLITAITAMKSVTSEMIVKRSDKQFSRYGVPSTLRTENGPNLVSAEMEEYLNKMSIAHRLTTPLWPRANREMERRNRSFLKAMRVAHTERETGH